MPPGNRGPVFRGPVFRGSAVRALLTLGLFAAAALAHGNDPGTSAPGCRFAQLAGRPGGDLQQFHGRVVYLDFWASWCAPCAQAFPFLNALHKEFGGRGLAVVGVNVDELPADALRFLQRTPATFAIGADATGSCPRAFGVEAMPTSYLIDRSGTIRHVHAGFRAGDVADLRRRVEQLLGEGTDGATPRTGLR
jgi:thiol-disulfide isomerase/thioredoxin